MGTNYYLVKKKPTLDRTLHIGKASVGWRFLFYKPAIYEVDRPLNTFEQWRDYLKEATESHEYADGNGNHEYIIKEFPKTEAGVRSAIIPADFTWLADRLKLLNPFGEYIFTNNGKRLTTNTIRRRLTRVCKKLDIYAKSPHKIRKTYGSILIDNNLDARLITDLMGHTNISTTEQHYHRNRKTMLKKAQIIANIPEFQAK